MIEPIATHPEGEIVWMPRTDDSPAEAVAYVAKAADLDPAALLDAVPVFMRTVTEADCEADSHEPDAEGDRPEDCDCGLIEEGWMVECAPGDEHAVPVWRVEL